MVGILGVQSLILPGCKCGREGLANLVHQSFQLQVQPEAFHVKELTHNYFPTALEHPGCFGAAGVLKSGSY
jgi:hypothetical protein